MPQYPSWRLEGGGQVLDLETAVKDGILGGAAGAGAPLGTAEKLELKKMIEELESSSSPLDDDIPSVFICPISLEPMTDPVTLCTGQTYERANILRWFSTGHLTCPTTMQSLWDDAITPNTTLHHLTLTWFSHRYLHFKKRADDVQGRAADLLSSLRRLKGQPRVHSLKDLHRLVAAHPSARLSSAAPQISSLLGPFTSHAVGSEAVGILVHLPLHLDPETKSSLSQPPKISLIVDILNEGTIETKINCTKLVAMLIDDNQDFVVSSLSLLVGLLRLIKDKRHPDCTPAGLTLLHKICCKDNQVLPLVISVGAVPQLVDLLLPASLNPECLECALHVLDRLSTLPQGRSALKDCPHTITHLVRLLMRVSEACTQYALSILWEVCKLAPDECASMAVEAGLAAKLLLVIQSGCEPALKQRSAELLKLCSLNYTATLFISKCKLTRTIQ